MIHLRKKNIYFILFTSDLFLKTYNEMKYVIHSFYLSYDLVNWNFKSKLILWVLRWDPKVPASNTLSCVTFSNFFTNDNIWLVFHLMLTLLGVFTKNYLRIIQISYDFLYSPIMNGLRLLEFSFVVGTLSLAYSWRSNWKRREIQNEFRKYLSNIRLGWVTELVISYY